MKLNQGYSYRHVLGSNAIGQTATSYLAKFFSHSNEVEWRTRIEAGEIQVDGKILSSDEMIHPGSSLVWNRPGWIEDETPQSFELVYLDSDLLAVNKPSGLPTLPGGGFYLNTLLHLVRAKYPEARPLHRLGRATSGLVLFALNHSAASKITLDWSKVEKTYQGLGSGVAAESSYDIGHPIGKEMHPRLGDVFAASSVGKPARSVARTIERRMDSTLFEIDLHTGRPHQIRIHLAVIGHPLVGDPLYEIGGKPKQEDPGLPGDSGYHLHAKRIALEHPTRRTRVELYAALPGILRISGIDSTETQR